MIHYTASKHVLIGMAARSRPNMMTPSLPTWILEPEDVADVVCRLATDDSRYLTAAAITVDQGSTQY